MKNRLLRVAAVHDLSGFGRCALTVIIPVLSSMGIQVIPLPTAILSTHTGGFSDYTFVDLSDNILPAANHWKSLNIDFDCIYSGFFGSAGQIDSMLQVINMLKNDETFVVVDPVLGDDGELYDTIDNAMVEKMRSLIASAHLITPNFTEAALLLNRDIKNMSLASQKKTDRKTESYIEISDVKSWLVDLSKMGPEIVLITSVPEADGKTAVVAYDRQDDRFWKVSCDYFPADYPGTGDAYTSVLIGGLLQGDNLPIAMDRAVEFVSLGIRTTYGYKCNPRDGILLEKILSTLNLPVTKSRYKIF